MTESRCDHPHSHACQCAIQAVATQSLEEMEFERGIWQAASSGDLTKMASLLSRSSSRSWLPLLTHLGARACANAKDSSGYTALHYASRAGCLQACKLLLEHGASVRERTRSGATALHRAAYAGHAEVVRLLLASGAEVDARDDDGCTALHKAYLAGNTHVIPLLLAAGADEAARDNQGRTPSQATANH